MPQLKWAVVLTTVPMRRKDLLPRTLASLREGGFTDLRLCVDGDNDALSWEREFGLPVSCRHPNIRTFGNWILALGEAFIREPNSDRFLVAQDDFVTYRNLRQYLERVNYLPKTYKNLYTFPQNQALCPKDGNGKPCVGWYPSNQKGRGAVALVFDRETVITLLTARHMIQRPMDAHRGWKAVDGGIVTALAKEGWTEMVHNPSLVQHVGDHSSMRNRPHQKANSFRGEDFDALRLLEEQ